MAILRSLLGVAAAAGLASCAGPGVAGGVQTSPSPQSVVESTAPSEPAVPAAEPPFATLPIDDWSTVQDAALHGAVFQIVGQCTIAEVAKGHQVLLLWPDGHVEFDEGRGVVRFTDVVSGEVTDFTVGQVVDFRVTPGGADRGGSGLPSQFAVPLDPSCVYQDYVIVTGVTIR